MYKKEVKKTRELASSFSKVCKKISSLQQEKWSFC
jgi:hypothetical protein